jgi:hypothetical protein
MMATWIRAKIPVSTRRNSHPTRSLSKRVQCLIAGNLMPTKQTEITYIQTSVAEEQLSTSRCMPMLHKRLK